MLYRVLATMPPAQWAEVMRRASVISDYLERPDTGGEEATRAAATLGLNVRSFYRIARAYRLVKEGADVTHSRRGLYTPTHERTSEIIGETVRSLGREASDAAVLRVSVARCREEGLPPPSMSAVRIRTGAGAGPLNLEKRLRRRFDVVVDACPLDLDVDPTRGAVDMAVLTTVIDGADGSILSHRLTAGWPRPFDVASVLSSAFPGARKPDVPTAILVATGALGETLAPIIPDLARCGLVIDEASSRGLRAGSACVPVLGRRLGRVALAPSRLQPTGSAPGVSLPVAARVVDLLVAELPVEILPIVGSRRMDGRVDGPALRTVVQTIEF